MITERETLGTARRTLIRVALMLAFGAGIVVLAACSSLEGGPPLLTNADDLASAQAACLKDKGWDVVIEPDSGITWEGPTSQIDQYREALEECRADTSSGGPQDQELTDDMLRTAYGMQVKTLECLRAEGYDDLSDPPTLQAYVDSRGQWTPYSELPIEISRADWYTLLETCPQPSISPSDH